MSETSNFSSYHENVSTFIFIILEDFEGVSGKTTENYEKEGLE